MCRFGQVGGHEGKGEEGDAQQKVDDDVCVAPFPAARVGREECCKQHEDALLTEKVECGRQGKEQGVGRISAVEREGQADHMQGDGSQRAFDNEGEGQEDIAQVGVDADEVLGGVAVAAVFGGAVALP